jgi:mono/diheme cytochrome c family protein
MSLFTRYGFKCFAFALILAAASMPGPSLAQQGADPAAIERGHKLAITLCAICHVAAPDQPSMPVLHPPAPPFATLVKSKSFDAASLTKFLTTTHRGLDRPDGMPNPDLMDYQVKDIVAYFLSLYQK